MEYKPENRICQNCKKDFIIEPDDFSFYEKIKVPPPTWCPECRFQRRCLFRNERKLFRNIDGFTGKPILSLYPPEAEFPVYEDSYWSSDNWDPFSYGVDFDRSKPFLTQLYELNLRVPHPRSDAINMVRSDYSANAADLKNCYLIFNATSTEDSAYGNAVDYCKNCFDNSHISSSERCYESFWLNKCYDTNFSSECDECVSVYFSKNCVGCSNCFGCVNLRNKTYCYFNEQLSKEEYQEKIKNLELSKWSNIQKVKEKSELFWLDFPVKYVQGIKNYDCSGEYISNSKNVRNSYLVRGGEDLKYVHYSQTTGCRDSMDTTVSGLNSELIYECMTCGWNSSQARFSFECWDGGIDFEYSMFCGKKANHVFGSVSINSGDYVILNKKYHKEEFYKLRDEIRKHMDEMPYVDKRGRVYKYGEFFPPEFSPFAYNDTITPEHFPLSKDEIISYGANWYEIPKTEYNTTINSSDIPDDIRDVKDEIVKEIISCEKCNRAYKIIPEELQFLRQNNLPIPHSCVDCRHKERISQRNKSKLYRRKCNCNGECSSNNNYDNTIEHFHGKDQCKVEFETSYAPDRPEIVYCEKCYQQEVY
ncbi:hypothetical protein HXX01_01275 [Candidatus Nomurabacteria bacterium]|nr:hypothetical protein [Candidatus Nomurabacteria bacterium]